MGRYVTEMGLTSPYLLPHPPGRQPHRLDSTAVLKPLASSYIVTSTQLATLAAFLALSCVLQVWLALYNLVVDPGCRAKMGLESDSRCEALLKLKRHFTELLLDQVLLVKPGACWVEQWASAGRLCCWPWWAGIGRLASGIKCCSAGQAVRAAGLAPVSLLQVLHIHNAMSGILSLLGFKDVKYSMLNRCMSLLSFPNDILAKLERLSDGMLPLVMCIIMGMPK